VRKISTNKMNFLGDVGPYNIMRWWDLVKSSGGGTLGDKLSKNRVC
jgi:hypothetical protein